VKTVAIIQARMGSTRLPGKVLMDIAGKPMLQHVIERARRIQGVDQVIVATTNRPDDVAVVELASGLHVATYCGDEHDVLSRYVEAAAVHNAETIVRLTGDCPLLDPSCASLVLGVYRAYRAQGLDPYVSNVHPVRTWPRGYDTEVFSAALLGRADAETRLLSSVATYPYHREHVTPWMQRTTITGVTGRVISPVNFDIWADAAFTVNVTNPHGDESAENLSVDTPEDLARVRRYAGELALGAGR
jgi:spore coat polysaccharide biosynthesis protein SpsF